VITILWEQAAEGNATVMCFYFHFATREEQYPAVILGSVLKLVVGVLNEVLQTIVKPFQEREGHWWPEGSGR